LAIAADPCDLAAAKHDLLAALETARQQKAKSFELRSGTSLCSFYDKVGRTDEAYIILGPITNRFTEGHLSRDWDTASELRMHFKARIQVQKISRGIDTPTTPIDLRRV
jgi:hypothetical protein